MLERYPPAYLVARSTWHAAIGTYNAALIAQALARRPYQIRKYLSGARGFTGLQIGAGHHQLAGWLKTDIEPDPETVYMDATSRFPFIDETFDYIVAEHIIEHVPYADALKMLRECRRVLKKDGVIRISTPNIELTHQLMHSPLTPALERYVSWSNRRHGYSDNLNSAIHVVNRLQHEWGHQFLYDRDTLVASLRRSGFVRFADCTQNKSAHAALTNVDRHGVEVGEEPNGLESLFIEATT